VLKGTQGQNARKPALRAVKCYIERRPDGTGTTTADRLKVAEAILKIWSTRKRVSLEHLYTQHPLMGKDVKWGAAHPVGTENKTVAPFFCPPAGVWCGAACIHTKRHEPWKQARQLGKKELDAASRRGVAWTTRCTACTCRQAARIL
jgi:hypothetical protein